MINSQFMLQSINSRIIGKEFIGIKEGKLVFSNIQNTSITREDLYNYILSNLKEMNLKEGEDYCFSMLTKNVNKEDEYIEVFKIPINEDFEDNLMDNLEKVSLNEEMFLRFSLYVGDENYLSDIIEVNISDLDSLGEVLNINLTSFTDKGTSSTVDVPSNVSLSGDKKMTITATHDKSEILDLKAYYDEGSNKIIIEKLVPSKSYSNVNIVTQDKDGRTINFKINKILMEKETELQDYISKIYLQVLKRYPTEEEYSNMLYNLSNDKVTLNEVIIDMIVTDEFNSINDTPKKIIESIYFLTNKKTINSRLSVLILDEFNEKLIDSNNSKDVKIEILDRFLSMESSKEYITSELKVLIK